MIKWTSVKLGGMYPLVGSLEPVKEQPIASGQREAVSDCTQQKTFEQQASRDKLLESFLQADRMPKTPAEANTRLSALCRQRDQLEAHLPADTKKELQNLRNIMSCADDAAQQDTCKLAIDALDSSLAKTNRQIEQIVTNSKYLRQADNPNIFARHSIMQCHQPSKESPSFAEGLFARSWTNQLPESQLNWYAPHAELHKLAKHNGLKVEFQTDGDKSVPAFYIASGKDRKYVPIDTSGDIRQQFDQLIETKLQQLENKYGVSFSRDSAASIPLNDNPVTSFFGVACSRPAQQPLLAELYGIEDALEKSKPTYDGEKIKFYFLSEMMNSQRSSDIQGEYHNGKVMLHEGLKQDDPLSETRDVIIHELAHHYQHKIDLDNQAAVIEKLGWQQSKGWDGCWLLRGKDGEFYKHVKGLEWLLCNERGNAIDRQGNPVSAGQAVELYPLDVAINAQVSPATMYFDNPREMHAEAMMRFRASSATRSYLAHSKDLYDLIKKQDQKEIDTYYDRHFKGKTGIRLPDGNIVDRTAQSESAVTTFERSIMLVAALNHNRDELLTKLDPLVKPWLTKEARELEVIARAADSLAPRVRALENQIDELKVRNPSYATPKLLSHWSGTVANYNELRQNICVHKGVAQLGQWLGNLKKEPAHSPKASETKM